MGWFLARPRPIRILAQTCVNNFYYDSEYVCFQQANIVLGVLEHLTLNLHFGLRCVLDAKYPVHCPTCTQLAVKATCKKLNMFNFLQFVDRRRFFLYTKNNFSQKTCNLSLASPAMRHWGTCPSSTSKSNCLIIVTSQPHKL